jgi:UDP:flavonoid glycosyltransferase YjiC (YdhE family)
MRILLTAFPGYGHVYPILPMARAAQRAGHDVVIATGPNLTAMVAQFGLTTWQVGTTGKESEAQVIESSANWGALDPEQRMPRFFADMFAGAGAIRATDLVPLAMEWKPDLIVHEIAEPAGAVAAAHTGARHASHAIGRLPARIWPAYGHALDALGDRWDVSGLTTRILAAPYLDTYPPALQPRGPAMVRDRWPLRPTSGELRPGSELGFDPDDLPYDDTVYVTLGTVSNGAPGVFETVLAALLQMPVNVVVTVGPGTDTDRLGSLPDHVVVADFIPQSLLLPRCRLMISHGGGGTMTGALCHGLPQLILPQGADHFLNAEAATAAGVALTIAPGEMTLAAVTTAIERLLTEPAFTAAAHRVRREIDAMPDADAVLQRLLKEV